MSDKPELQLRYTPGTGYEIRLVGHDKWLGDDVSDEELDNSDQFLDPVLQSIQRLRDAWLEQTGKG